MTKVLIIGAGDSGLNLCNRLLGAGIEVTLADPRTPEAILWEPEHKLTSLNLPYSQNLIRPEWSGLSQWESKAREVSFRTVQLRLHDPEEPGKELSLVGSLPGEGGFAFEPRLRQHCWLSAATDPVLHDGRPARHVEALYEHSALDFAASRRIADIVVVAVGNGRLGHEFDADAERAGRLRGAGGRPRVRTVTQAYFHALRPGEADAQVISAPAGEVIAVPAFTTEGPAHSIQLIGTPDGPLDCAARLRAGGIRQRPEHVHRTMLEALSDLAPELHDRLLRAEVDPSSVMTTTITPRVRRPVVRLPGGGWAVGLGDTLTTLDPASAQEGGAAPRAAAALGDAIIACHREGRPFGPAEAEAAFERYWSDHGQPAAVVAEMVSWYHQSPRMQAFFAHAAEDPGFADQWAAGIDDPKLLAGMIPAADR